MQPIFGVAEIVAGLNSEIVRGGWQPLGSIAEGLFIGWIPGERSSNRIYSGSSEVALFSRFCEVWQLALKDYSHDCEENVKSYGVSYMIYLNRA